MNTKPLLCTAEITEEIPMGYKILKWILHTVNMMMIGYIDSK